MLLLGEKSSRLVAAAGFAADDFVVLCFDGVVERSLSVD
jgi:hypothetical protein